MVAEIEPLLVEWMRDGVVPSVLDDPRVSVVVGDVREVVASSVAGALDGILLDVDNGPDYLVYESMPRSTSRRSLLCARTRLRADGVLTVWSSSASPALEDAVQAVFGHCEVKPVPVQLQGRAETYYVYQASS